MYGDEKFRLLSKPKPNGQTLFIYLFTGPHTGVIPGLFLAGERQLAEALEWRLSAFRRCFSELTTHGMAVADWGHRLVYLPRAKYHNPPASPNVVTGWAQAFQDLPDCPLILTAREDFGLYGHSEVFTEAFQEVFRKGFGQTFANSSSSRREEKSSSSTTGALAVPIGSDNGKPAHRQATREEQLEALARSNQTTAEDLLRAGHAKKQQTKQQTKKR